MAAIILVGLGAVLLLGLGAYGLTSMQEGEPRAARLAFGGAVVLSLPLFLAALLPAPVQWGLVGLIGGIVAVGAVLFLLPVGRAEWGDDVPRGRIDERDIMFARARLEPGTANYQAYYALRPENQAGDDRTRSLPGLCSPESSEANPPIFAATDAAFEICEVLKDVADGPHAAERVETGAAEMSAYLKGLTRYLGAHSAGIAALEPYHVYSHIGRGRGAYGAPITLEHRYAIAFSVEMEGRMVGNAPAAPTLLESARQYANAAQIAVQLGSFIRSQGYPARAHINGNYQVVAPLVARDAGLGEIGRMGLLMTPGLGPRVRLGVVTTDLPLVPDGRRHDPSVLDFCRNCRKCADNCPVKAIPAGDREAAVQPAVGPAVGPVEGALRWRINQEICYRYWCVVGTDCARCMAVCPYSHPANAAHNLVRRAIRRSGVARRAALWLDDLFYGSRPEPKPAPAWVPPKDSQGRGLKDD